MKRRGEEDKRAGGLRMKARDTETGGRLKRAREGG
jgi:hypothetical protein